MGEPVLPRRDGEWTKVHQRRNPIRINREDSAEYGLACDERPGGYAAGSPTGEPGCARGMADPGDSYVQDFTQVSFA
ncbi:hypothetical protein Asi03nite_48160 [Actinoplanes siamensis]|uniref:Uncharacterized protein n=1 Tax=Actinoplanes siamensis TaxID=1223317 RepID=A0A919NAC9_9ACTN|nr:hypothetical protein Asi03nite_48160 [Actinoplanes siamensis]